MDFYVLHYMIFSITKLANPHIMLDEFNQLVWVRAKIESTTNDTTSLSFGHLVLKQQASVRATLTWASDLTHLSLIMIYLLNFFLSIKICQYADRNNQHRSVLIQLLAGCVIVHMTYLYSVNTLASSDLTRSSLLLRLIHTMVILVQLMSIQCTCQCIQSLVDPLAINQCLKRVKTIAPHYQFITYMTIGALSISFSTLSLLEVLSRNSSIELNFTTSTLSVQLIAAFIMLIITGTMTTNSSDGAQYFMSANQPKTKTPLTFNNLSAYSHSDHGLKQGLAKLTSSILSISAASLCKENKGEVIHMNDEDECNVTGDVFHIRSLWYENRISRQRANPIDSEDIHLYDRNKFSLYEDYQSRDKEIKQCPKRLLPTYELPPDLLPYFETNIQFEKYALKEDQFKDVFTLLRTKGNQSFGLDAALLLLIGSIFQAHQLCFFADYLRYLVRDSPFKLSHRFRASLDLDAIEQVNPDGLRYNLDDAAYHIWIQLVAACLIIQSLGRAISLHFSANLILKLGRKPTLMVLMILASSIPVQFFANYYLIYMLQSEGVALNTNLSVIICQLLFIELQVGLIGAIADFMINDLALSYSRQAADAQLTDPGASARIRFKSEHCTLHSLLSGLFYNLGGAFAMVLRCIISFGFYSLDTFSVVIPITLLQAGYLALLILIIPLIIVAGVKCTKSLHGH